MGGNGYEDKRALGSSEKLWNKLVSYGGTTSLTYGTTGRVEGMIALWLLGFFPFCLFFRLRRLGLSVEG